MSKKIKRALITLAIASVVTCSTALSACTIKTDHPQVKITVSFLEKKYEIDYTLYRNMYPQTVQHFIELTDAGFYNNMIVHDYQDDSDWFSGAYSYSEEHKDLYVASTFSQYLENTYKEAEYYALFADGKLSPSVYSQPSYDDKGEITVSKTDALPTLIGEFSNNNHSIKKGELRASFGALKMFYYNKSSSEKKATVQNWAGEIFTQDYKYNCATSVFSMQVGGSSYGSSSYCVFGKLKNDKAEDVLNKLMDAVEEYREEVSSSKFETSGVETRVDTLDAFAEFGETEVKFTMTSEPIIIKSVKVTKY